MLSHYPPKSNVFSNSKLVIDNTNPNGLDISIKSEKGKKKLKKDIYNEINLKHFTQDI